MSMGKRVCLANTVGLNPVQFQVQTPSIWAYLDSKLGDIHWVIFEACLTYLAWEISIERSTEPLASKF